MKPLALGWCLVLLAGSAHAAPPLADEEVFQTLDAKLGTSGAYPQASGTSTAERAARLRAFVRARLREDSLYPVLARELFAPVLRETSAISFPVMPLILQQAADPGAKPYFYLDKKCPAAERVDVHPWWDRAQSVSICADAYQPERTVDSKLGFAQSCEYSLPLKFNGERRTCRCGALLLNCARDEKMHTEMVRQMDDEPVRTLEYVIQHHLAFTELFRMSSTVRGDFADFFYARSASYLTGTLEGERFSASSPPRLREREAYLGGGILSTPAVAYYSDNFRGLIMDLWSAVLCSPLTSMAVDAHVLFHLPEHVGADFRFHERPELMEMQGCQSCHLRLENGIRAFEGFSVIWKGRRFDPHTVYPGQMQLFLDDPMRPVAKGPANLAWLGDTIAHRPETLRCAVTHVLDMLYNGLPVPPSVSTRLEQSFAQKQDFSGLLEDAVIARYLGERALGAAPAQEARR